MVLKLYLAIATEIIYNKIAEAVSSLKSREIQSQSEAQSIIFYYVCTCFSLYDYDKHLYKLHSTT